MNILPIDVLSRDIFENVFIAGRVLTLEKSFMVETPVILIARNGLLQAEMLDYLCSVAVAEAGGHIVRLGTIPKQILLYELKRIGGDYAIYIDEKKNDLVIYKENGAVLEDAELEKIKSSPHLENIKEGRISILKESDKRYFDSLIRDNRLSIKNGLTIFYKDAELCLKLIRKYFKEKGIEINEIKVEYKDEADLIEKAKIKMWVDKLKITIFISDEEVRVFNT